jgi:hypothetical protein
VAYTAVRTAARNLERRAGLAQEKRMGIVRVPADEVEVFRAVGAAGDRQVLLTRIGAVRDTLPPDLAEEIDRYLMGERSLGRRERRAALQALREALGSHSEVHPDHAQLAEGHSPGRIAQSGCRPRANELCRLAVVKAPRPGS